MSRKIPIAVAHGDGIGPEIMDATLHILTAAGTHLDFRKIEIGEKLYLKGQKSGIDPSTWEILKECQAFLKAPITTPQGGGYKSLNVTFRTTLGLYANVRPCVSYSPFVATKHPLMDVVIVRENEEDLYAGIEYRQTPDVCETIKIISRPGTEKIVRYAFEYAKANKRKKVTCFTKDNIMKFTDGLFHKVFDEIAAQYPDIINEHWIVDIGAAKLADTPEAFDVIVLPNLYGDILSDVAAQIAGSVGLAGSANIGEKGAMFEAIHGSAPRRAGQNVANPSGLILASVLMLEHIGLVEAAAQIHNAWLKTIEDGIHTYDIYKEGISKSKVGTKEFAEAVVKRLGQKPEQLKAASQCSKERSNISQPASYSSSQSAKKRSLVGCDVFIYAHQSVNQIQEKLNHLKAEGLKLTLISNRGVQAWPNAHPDTSFIEQWRCRFMSNSSGATVSPQQIVLLLKELADSHIDFIKTENLYSFDGVAGYSHADN